MIPVPQESKMQYWVPWHETPLMQWSVHGPLIRVKVHARAGRVEEAMNAVQATTTRTANALTMRMGGSPFILYSAGDRVGRPRARGHPHQRAGLAAQDACADKGWHRA
jgi:hypothetical protein